MILLISRLYRIFMAMKGRRLGLQFALYGETMLSVDRELYNAICALLEGISEPDVSPET